VCVPLLETVSFAQISRILDVTDRVGLSRERVEIPLSPATPGRVHTLPNGKLEIVVDAEQPFDQWLAAIEPEITRVAAAEQS
jgi:hypothetical protein